MLAHVTKDSPNTILVQDVPREAVILCGGLGTRLRSVVDDRPKCMALVGGHPFLEWWLRRLQSLGCRRGILCVGYKGEVIREYFGDGIGDGLSLIYSQEQELLGTGGALRQALSYCATDSILALNGDSWCDTDFKPLYEWHYAKRAVGTLLLTHVEESQRYGQVRVTESGIIDGFSEKGDTKPESGWVNAGVYILSRELLESIPEGIMISLEHEIFPDWIKKGLFGYRGEGAFIDIGIPESYRAANAMFKNKNCFRYLSS